MTFRELQSLVKQLFSRVKILEDIINGGAGCSCECKVHPYYIQLFTHSIEQYFDGSQYDMAQVYQYLNLNDRFPGEVCAGEKGILFCSDATLFCYYNDQDGWIATAISRVNNYLS